jgi:hypothetical protein
MSKQRLTLPPSVSTLPRIRPTLFLAETLTTNARIGFYTERIIYDVTRWLVIKIETVAVALRITQAVMQDCAMVH